MMATTPRVPFSDLSNKENVVPMNRTVKNVKTAALAPTKFSLQANREPENEPSEQVGSKFISQDP